MTVSVSLSVREKLMMALGAGITGLIGGAIVHMVLCPLS